MIFVEKTSLTEKTVDVVLLKAGQGGAVDARCAVVGTHHDLRTPENIPAVDLVSQRVEPPSGISLGRPVKRMLQSTDLVRGRTSSDGGTSYLEVSPTGAIMPAIVGLCWLAILGVLIAD